MSYLPGGLASSSVSYHACFHDLPDGLQTHVYAPLGLDIRAKWSVGGSLPGEPKVPVELGIGAPREGLYIREDVRMKCNIMMMSFVKKTFKESHAKLVDRLVEKAHVLESSLANERLKQLKNVAPGERMGHGSIYIAPPPGYEEYQQPHMRKQSVNSDASTPSLIHSPGLSQASTMTSQSEFPSSPPQQYGYQLSPSHPSPLGSNHVSLANAPRQYQHHHSHSQDCDHRGSFRFGVIQQSSKDEGKQEQPPPLPQTLSYLPATVYNPHQRHQSMVEPSRASQYNAYQPPPTELPAHMQDSPTLPRDVGEDQRKNVAELPA